MLKKLGLFVASIFYSIMNFQVFSKWLSWCYSG